MGHAPEGDRGLRRSHELILFAKKGGKDFYKAHSDIIEVPNVRNKDQAASPNSSPSVVLHKASISSSPGIWRTYFLDCRLVSSTA